MGRKYSSTNARLLSIYPITDDDQNRSHTHTHTYQHADALTFCSAQDNFSRDIREKPTSIPSPTGCQRGASVIKLHMHTVAQAAAQPNPADSQRLLGQNSTHTKKKQNKTKQDGADRDGKVRRRTIKKKKKSYSVTRHGKSSNLTLLKQEQTSQKAECKTRQELTRSLTHSSENTVTREAQ